MARGQKLSPSDRHSLIRNCGLTAADTISVSLSAITKGYSREQKRTNEFICTTTNNSFLRDQDKMLLERQSHGEALKKRGKWHANVRCAGHVGRM